MTKVTLQRFAYTPMGTFGVLTLPSGATVYTCEDPDERNESGKSCIPEGTYTCKPSRYYTGGYETHEVLDVPGRSRILVHRGNNTNDVAGCIALGLRLGYVANLWAVTDSKQAFADYYKELGNLTYTLEIKRAQPSKEIAMDTPKLAGDKPALDIPPIPVAAGAKPGAQSSEFKIAWHVLIGGGALVALGVVANVIPALGPLASLGLIEKGSELVVSSLGIYGGARVLSKGIADVTEAIKKK